MSLPEFAIPTTLSITDPRNHERQFKRAIRRDDRRNRFVIYLECSSSFGTLDFNFSCDFLVDLNRFQVEVVAEFLF